MCLQLIQDFINQTYTQRLADANNNVADLSSTAANNGSAKNESASSGRSSPASISKSTQTMIWSLTTTMFVPGGMIGALTTGIIADKMGR